MASLGELFSALVERVMGRVDAFALYPATVKAMNDDGTVDVKPDSTRWGAGLSRVPVRGLPGVAVKVKTGARVHLAFSEGDVTRPVAVLFDADSLDTLTITATTKIIAKAPQVFLGDETDARPIARAGDLIEVYLPAVPPLPPIPLQGYISNASTKVNAT